MKGIIYLIIASVVWSIISGIIEKRKAAAKKEAAKVRLSGDPVQQVKPPVNVKVQSLRTRRKPATATPSEPVVVPKPSINEPIAPLHKEDCPLPPKFKRPGKPVPAHQLAEMLKNRRNIRTAIVLAEILDKPVSMR